ncbi:malonate decarboxylase holo-[acyl-carrier-protein] synthase [Ancylobacter sp. MQZ15Z-1]|uniref:Malonate decarboxylase holo-[acyl-carrier-protein] synthase n=1 Tax=Ancylobacter mangrovi TaxID=2972472 RepID=A0A9X2T5F9_9HYPH|nr:malonate decarboxylase holo-[acyl-carrier-protein] synthase [Ancylobacter mangrovi]MCS0497241.1 malonate decarboxylase holo-[acyl-carrier-protein] synthase [Ancylobacter mangrovi]
MRPDHGARIGEARAHPFREAPSFARHDLVWLDPACEGVLEAGRAQDRALAAAWIRAGRPLVVRRDEQSPAPAGSGWLALGLPLPTRFDRRRIGLRVPEAMIVRRGRMPLLAEAGPSAFSGWRALLRDLARDLASCGATVRVYGSLGWQYLTGEGYLHPASDIDLLIEPGARLDLHRLLAVLGEAAWADRPRLDGEIRLAPDRAVAWRELLSNAPEVLVRELDGLSLVPRAAALRELQPGVPA